MTDAAPSPATAHQSAPSPAQASTPGGTASPFPNTNLRPTINMSGQQGPTSGSMVFDDDKKRELLAGMDPTRVMALRKVRLTRVLDASLFPLTHSASPSFRPRDIPRRARMKWRARCSFSTCMRALSPLRSKRKGPSRSRQSNRLRPPLPAQRVSRHQPSSVLTHSTTTRPACLPLSGPDCTGALPGRVLPPPLSQPARARVSAAGGAGHSATGTSSDQLRGQGR